MKRILSLLALTSSLIFSIAIYAHIPTTVNGKTLPSLAPMLKNVMPAIVNIAVEQKPKSQTDNLEKNPTYSKPRSKDFSAVGSGIIYNAKKGLILTNAHVVKDEAVMLVTLKDGRRYRATLVGKDSGFDIAIIKIRAKHLHQIPFGDSDALKVGDFVTAIGSPFGLTQTVTSGVISALNRVTPQIEGFQSFIQTDASINPGNSGGALVNLRGQVIGMNTAMVSPTYGNIGIGFAIPSNMVHAVVTQLLKYGKVSRGMLGLTAQNITPSLAQGLHLKNDRGVVATKIIPLSPADKAGFEVQDVIVGVNGKAVRSAAQLHNILGLMRPGTKIIISIIRDGRSKTLSATVGDPKKMAKLMVPFINGMRLQDFSELEPDGSEITGALIISLSDDSPGALAGLQQGDVIMQANGRDINAVPDLIGVISKKPKELLLKVSRGSSNLFLVLRDR